MPEESGVRRAVRLAGGATELARIAGGAAKRQNVEYWLKAGVVPPEYCASIEASLGVRRWELRPHDWHRIWPELTDDVNAPEAPLDRPAADEPEPERRGPNLPKSGNGPSPGMEPNSGSNEREKATACGA